MYRRVISGNSLPSFAPHDPDTPPPGPRLKRWIIIGSIGLVIVFGIILKTVRTVWPNDPSAYDALSLRPKRTGIIATVKNFIFRSETVLIGESDDRVNILLLGIGGAGHEGPFLSDTNIVVSIKPSTREVAMISVPRDLGIRIPGHGLQRVNSASAFGELKKPGNGGDFAREIFSETFGVSIPYYVRVDFKAFQELVDAVGGVDIDVPRGFVDEQFPGPNFSFRVVSFAAGREHMDGARALDFARSRHGNNGEGSDFARSRRQQLVLTALKQKLLSYSTYANPATIQQIMESLTAHVTTNLSFGEMMYLANMARDIGEIKTVVLDTSPEGPLVETTGDNGAFMLAPKDGTFTEITRSIMTVFDPTAAAPIAITPSTTTKKIPVSQGPGQRIEVQNGTWRVGLASRTQKYLENAGLTVGAIGNNYKRPIADTGIYLLTPKPDQETVMLLEKMLGVQASQELPEWMTAAFNDPETPEDETGPKFALNTDILVLLGNDIPLF